MDLRMKKVETSGGEMDSRSLLYSPEQAQDATVRRGADCILVLALS